MTRSRYGDIEVRTVAFGAGNDGSHFRGRDLAVEHRAKPDGTAPGHLSAYAAVFNSLSRNLGGFVEAVDPRAFTRTLQTAEVVASWNHNFDVLLGRRGANMTVEADSIGLRYGIDLPDTTAARDLATLVDLKIVRGSSFTFRCTRGGDEWGYTEDGFPRRTLLDVELIEVAPVVFPAYRATENDGNEVALRSFARFAGVDVDRVLEARGDLTKFMPAKDTTDPAPRARTPEVDAQLASRQAVDDDLSSRLAALQGR